MCSNRRIAQLATLLLALLLSAACRGGEEPIALAPEMGPVIPFGPAEVRDLAPTTQVVPNCSGITSPIVNHPSMTVGSAHSVEWQVGGEVGMGLTIGKGVVPGGVDLQGVLEGHVANDLNNFIQQGNAWDLPAEPGYIMEYTIMWREVWQPAYLDVTFMDPEPEVIKIDLKYRTGIQSDIVGQKATLCDPGAATQPETDSSTAPPAAPELEGASVPPTPTNTPIPPVTRSVWATNESGEIFSAERTGTYEVRYLGDAYSAWPSDQAEGYRGWTTILRYYVNRAIEWGITDFGLPGPVNEDGYLTPGNYYLNKDDAIASAGSDRRTVHLNAGEYITLIVLDEQGRYFDNQGKVDVQITYLGE